jgi:hypothetical protein
MASLGLSAAPSLTAAGEADIAAVATAAAAATAGLLSAAGAAPPSDAYTPRAALLLLRLLNTASQLRKCRSQLVDLGAVNVLVARVHACMRQVLQLHAASRVPDVGGIAGVLQSAAAGVPRVPGSQLAEQLEVLHQLLALLEVLGSEAAAAAAANGSWVVGGRMTPMSTAADAGQQGLDDCTQQVHQYYNGCYCCPSPPYF